MDRKKYSLWFLAPSLSIFVVMFIIPTLLSFYFSLTVWNFDSIRFTGLDNFRMFFSEPHLNIGIRNTLIYAVSTSGLKVILAFLIAIFLTSAIKTKTLIRSLVFFPNLVSTIAIGLTFKSLLHPTRGLINTVLGLIGIPAIDWLGNTDVALYSIIMTDVWKGLSIATVIYIAGIQSIDSTYYEAASIDGASGWYKLIHITLPLSRPSRNSVLILSFIGGIRTFDMIWAMTGGGPGFATDVLASIVYKQYAAGFYGLSTAGNVIMLVLIALLAYPLQRFLYKREVA